MTKKLPAQKKIFSLRSPPGLLTFWKSKKKWKYGSTSTVSHPLHNFQPDPQEGVNSKSKVITVSLHPLGKVYQEDWNPTVLSSCRFLVVNFHTKFEEELEISRRQNLKGRGINFRIWFFSKYSWINSFERNVEFQGYQFGFGSSSQTNCNSKLERLFLVSS